jgi:hypothetical protein
MDIKKLVRKLDREELRAAYGDRLAASRELNSWFYTGQVETYAVKAVAKDWREDGIYNWSSAVHRNGPQICAQNTCISIFDLAQSLVTCPDAKAVMRCIRNPARPMIGPSVASEMAMMLWPDRFYCGNLRTFWAYLVDKPGGTIEGANEQLELFADHNADCEIPYSVWSDLYEPLAPTIGRLALHGAKLLDIESIDFLLGDTVASKLYDKY